MSLHFLFFFFSSRRRHTRYWRDWSSDVCSSDLNWNLQLHARYFGKQYANLSNTLSFEPHWETFARLGYKFSKNINAYVNVVNLLNQNFAKSSISGTDLMTSSEAAAKYGTVMTGSYIRPFTCEFGINFNF